MKDRIQKILSHYSLSAAKFADIIGVQRSSVSHIVSERNKPSLEFLQKIMLSYPEINALWLLNGTGDFLNSPSKQPTLFEKKADTPVVERPLAQFKKKTTPLESNIPTPIEHFPGIDSSKQVEKVVIFYTDKTFASYTPDL